MSKRFVERFSLVLNLHAFVCNREVEERVQGVEMRPLAQKLYRYRKKLLESHLNVESNTPPDEVSPAMPKSKRAKVVHLTKVDKKGKELTIKLFANIRECLDQYQHCFVFSVDNMRNTYLKDVRNELSDSRCVIE
jgi:hypothetical protein